MALTVTLIANAGILLEYAGITILIDGLFHAGNAVPFSSPSSEIFDTMLRGDPPFQTIDYLLFTHNHIDHFSPNMLRAYLEKRPVRGVMLPSISSLEEENLASYMEERGIVYTALSDEAGDSFFTISKEISLRVMKARHLDHIYHDVPHYCFCLTISGQRFLITADLDYTNENLPCLEGHMRGVFINPLFFHALHDPAHFRGRLNAEMIFIYHVPFETDDQLNLRQLVTRDLSRWTETDRLPFVLSEPMQTISLEI